MKRLSAALLANAVLVSAGLAAASAAYSQIHLTPLSNSGETGTATLAQQPDGSLLITVVTRNGGSAPQPVHIHKGTCADSGAVVYALKTAINGKSVTTLKDVKLSDLASSANVINVHKSTTEMGTYTACGPITT